MVVILPCLYVDFSSPSELLYLVVLTMNLDTKCTEVNVIVRDLATNFIEPLFIIGSF